MRVERLTKRTSNGVAYMDIADTLPKRDQEIEGSKPILEGLYAIFQKLAEYEDAEEAGLLIKLPMEETVWVIEDTYKGKKIVDRKVVEFTIDSFVIGQNLTPIAVACNKENHWEDFELKDFGKTVFVTREEAERAKAWSGGRKIIGKHAKKVNSSPNQKKIKAALEAAGHTNVEVWWEPLEQAMEMCGLGGGYFFSSDQKDYEPLGLSHKEALDAIERYSWLRVNTED